MSEGVRRQLDVLDAQLELVKAMLAALRASLIVPQATVQLPSHCEGIPEALCALQHDDARIDKASLPRPNAWVCRGCSVYSEDGLTT